MSDVSDGCCTPGRRAPDRTPAKMGEVPTASSTATVRYHGDTLVRLPGGEFLMGTDDEEGFPADGEGPVRPVRLDPFAIDRHPVTNAQFAEFVDATGYVTEAEQFGWSFVFALFVPKKLLHRGIARKVPGLDWWYGVNNALWNSPEGPGSRIDDRWDHPVVHVSWADAAAYCDWAGKRLPTEAEWEYAARGGLEQKRYVWGDELTPGGRHMCNIWQGTFPRINTRADGYAGTGPAESYEPNGYGLYAMAGNVWEWCADWWSATYHREDTPEQREDTPEQREDTREHRYNPCGPPMGTSRVMRGGSYLCHHSYCNRYRVAARTSNTPDSSTGNLGFRAAADIAALP